jgi:hypothetical protein
MKLEDRKEPGFQNFQSIGDILALAREVAESDYALHLDALKKAPDSTARAESLDALKRSSQASEHASLALQYFLQSQNSFKQSTTEMLRGNTAEAEVTYERSGKQMQASAGEVKGFADYAPKSKLFNAALAFVSKRDQMIAKVGTSLDTAAAEVEATAARTGASFSRGLKAFADGMHEFGEKIKKVPEQIRTVAKERTISVVDATAEVAHGFLARARSMLGAIRNGVDRVKAATADTAYNVLDGVERFDNKVGEKLSTGLDTLRDHRDIATAAVMGKIEMAQDVAIEARQAAWARLDQLASATVDLTVQAKSGVMDAAQQVKGGAIAAGEAVERHAKATVAVAAGGAHLMKVLGSKVGESYKEALEEANMSQKSRRTHP